MFESFIQDIGDWYNPVAAVIRNKSFATTEKGGEWFMQKQNKTLYRHLNNIKTELSNMLHEIEAETQNINRKNLSLEGNNGCINSNRQSIQEMKDLQADLALLQARLANHLEKMDFTATSSNLDIEAHVARKIIPGGIKITIPDDYPPKTSVYNRVTIKNGKLNNEAYAQARDRWYSLIQKAMGGYDGERISPAIVLIKYYVPQVCDTGNFISKFILDGLMYNGAIAKDDNLYQVNAVVQLAVLDKTNPRTEIFVLKNTGQLDAVF